MPIFEKILSKITGSVVESAGNAVDSLITNDEERLTLKARLNEIITDFGKTLVNAQKDVLTTELSGSKLQRNWRPLLMLTFGGIIVYEYFFASVFNLPKSNLPADFWELLKIGLGGYVVGRSAEKITTTLTDKMDIIPRRKRRREL